MATIKVRVQGEIATNLTPEVKLVCQNDKYDVEFDFDESWANSNVKTALFIYNGKVLPVVFDRELDKNICKIPALYDTELLHIGVKSNDYVGLHTSTPARVGCLLSANDIANGEIPAPTQEVYDQIIDLLNRYITGGGSGEGGGLTEEEVKEIVSKSELNTRKQLVLGADGVVEEQVYSFTVENADSFLEYRTNLTKFLVDLNLPISGDLDTKKEVAITFGDTTYYVYNILKGMEHATIGDLHQVDKYNNETGYRFITEMTFFQTSDIVGFAIIPTVSVSDILALDSDEMDNYSTDGGLTQGQLAVCKEVITNGYTEGALYRYKITYPNTYEWEELSSGKIVDSDTITVMADGKAISLHLSAEIVADIQRALKIPMSAPSSTELVGVDNTKSQVSVEFGEVVKVGITANTETLTDDQQKSACDWLGALKKTKGTGIFRVYGTNTDGSQKMFGLTTASNISGAIVMRNGTQIRVPLKPIADDDSTSKHYVDNLPDNLTLTDEQKAKWKAWIESILT